MNFPSLNLPAFDIRDPITARNKAIFCKLKEMGTSSSIFIYTPYLCLSMGKNILLDIV
jgi:hypothetical protein